MDERTNTPTKTARWRLTVGLVGLVLLLGIAVGLHVLWPSAPTDVSPLGDVVMRSGDAAVPDSAVGQAGWVDQQQMLYHGIPSRIHFRLPAKRVGEGDEAARAAWDEFLRIGKAFNAFDPTSEVGEFNNPESKQIRAVSSEFSTLLELSREIFGLTGGAFDPTIWPLKALWQDAARTGSLPTTAEITRALAPVGMDRLTVMRRSALGKTLASNESNPSLVHRAMAGVALDFGGIVKGYAVDRVAALLRERGATDFLVQCGGEIATHGRSPSGEPWRLGVRHPLEKDAVWGSFSSPDDISVSTSGNYEQPVRVGDSEFHHIIDPRTGRPVESPILGVTVVVKGGVFPTARADAIATALTVMGVEAGRTLVESRPELAALFIVRGEDGLPTEVATARWAPMAQPAR